MLDAAAYMNRLTEELKAHFGSRLCYVGLQGSYLRGEATEHSDIDPMVVIDELSPVDLQTYRAIVFRMENPELSCGFICGKTELANWNPLEICHLLHSTGDWYGTLDELVPPFTQQDVRNFAKLSLNNLMHEICHRYIHASREKNAAQILGSYKAVFFILQNVHYLESGVFAKTKAELMGYLTGADRQVLAVAMGDKGMEFEEAFALLYTWCCETTLRLSEDKK